MNAAPDIRSVDLPPTARSASLGRHFVLDTLRDWGLSALEDVAGLITTEVVTNAVLHARTRLTLTLRRHGAGGVEVLVRDGSPHPPQRRRPDADSTSGRGLELLELLAASWSVEVTATGKTVQFCLDASDDPWAAATGGSGFDEAQFDEVER